MDINSSLGGKGDGLEIEEVEGGIGGGRGGRRGKGGGRVFSFGEEGDGEGGEEEGSFTKGDFY